VDATKPDVNLYAKWQQNISPSLQTFADIQWRYVQHRINGFRNNPALFLNNRYHFFNPKLGLSYSKNNWFLYTSYSIAHKEPNRDDFEAG
jgi:iron complex outermembrane receptor protein